MLLHWHGVSSWYNNKDLDEDVRIDFATIVNFPLLPPPPSPFPVPLQSVYLSLPQQEGKARTHEDRQSPLSISNEIVAFIDLDSSTQFVGPIPKGANELAALCHRSPRLWLKGERVRCQRCDLNRADRTQIDDKSLKYYTVQAKRSTPSLANLLPILPLKKNV